MWSAGKVMVCLSLLDGFACRRLMGLSVAGPRGQENCIAVSLKRSIMQKSKKPEDKKVRGEKTPSNNDGAPVNPVNITTETPTSRTGGGPAEGSRASGGPMKEDKTSKAAGGKGQREDKDMEDSMGSGKRQDDL